jgi:hypothetical protein
LPAVFPLTVRPVKSVDKIGVAKTGGHHMIATAVKWARRKVTILVLVSMF